MGWLRLSVPSSRGKWTQWGLGRCYNGGGQQVDMALEMAFFVAHSFTANPLKERRRWSEEGEK